MWRNLSVLHLDQASQTHCRDNLLLGGDLLGRSVSVQVRLGRKLSWCDMLMPLVCTVEDFLIVYFIKNGGKKSRREHASCLLIDSVTDLFNILVQSEERSD